MYCVGDNVKITVDLEPVKAGDIGTIVLINNDLPYPFYVNVDDCKKPFPFKPSEIAKI